MKQTKLSVNINKIATLRNSRGGNHPDLLKVAKDIEHYGADGITVHPRPDERHIRYQDVYDLKKIVTTEFNIEGNPKEKKFIDLVLANKPTQVTLVPDAEGQLTSDHGWDTIKNKEYLKEIIKVFKNEGIRVSIFVDPDANMVLGAKDTGTDRIELYTESYARELGMVSSQQSLVNSQQSLVINQQSSHSYRIVNSQESSDSYGIVNGQWKAIEPYISAAKVANEVGMGINAGHDLTLYNLKFFAQNIPDLLEVSIGHALICDAIYLGLENSVQLYKRQLKQDTQ